MMSHTRSATAEESAWARTGTEPQLTIDRNTKTGNEVRKENISTTHLYVEPRRYRTDSVGIPGLSIIRFDGLLQQSPRGEEGQTAYVLHLDGADIFDVIVCCVVIVV